MRKVQFVIVVQHKKRNKVVRIKIYNPQHGYNIIESLIRKGYQYDVEVPRHQNGK